MNGLMAYHAYIHTSDRHEYQHNLYSAKKVRETCKLNRRRASNTSTHTNTKSRGACAMRLFVWDGVLVLLMYFLMYLFSSVTHCILQLGH